MELRVRTMVEDGADGKVFPPVACTVTVTAVELWSEVSSTPVARIEPADNGLRIVSDLIENRMGLTFVEVAEPPALHVVLPARGPKEFDRQHPFDHSMEFEAAVEGAISDVYSRIFGDDRLTGAEQRAAWVLVMTRMLQSAQIDTMQEMIRERMNRRRDAL